MSTPIPIGDLVSQVSPSLWYLGSKIECKKSKTPDQTESRTASWKDGDFWYFLRPLSTKTPIPPDAIPYTSTSTSNSNDLERFYERAGLSAVWSIGNDAICKVKAWAPDISPESETINFIRKKAPQVSVPEVIHSWIDGGHSFLVIRRVHGKTLRDAWEQMTPAQQDHILNEIVRLCHFLASITSDKLQSIDGQPVCEPYLAHSDKDTLELLTASESARYFFREDLHPNPEIGGGFISTMRTLDLAILWSPRRMRLRRLLIGNLRDFIRDSGFLPNRLFRLGWILILLFLVLRLLSGGGG